MTQSNLQIDALEELDEPLKSITKRLADKDHIYNKELQDVADRFAHNLLTAAQIAQHHSGNPAVAKKLWINRGFCLSRPIAKWSSKCSSSISMHARLGISTCFR